MGDNIRVSIDCITYNHGAYLEEAIESFLAQKTDFEYEILIHDDASTDETQAIILRYQERYPDIIKPLIQDENQYSRGPKRMGYLYNVTRAKGDYIAICEGDDYWTDPHKLQKQVDYLDRHPESVYCFHQANIVDENGQYLCKITPYPCPQKADINDVIMNGGGFISSNSIVYRKDALSDPPDFYLNAPVGDYPLQIFLAASGDGYYMEEVMSSYRQNSVGSWSNDLFYRPGNIDKQIEFGSEYIDMLKEVDEYYKGKYDHAIKQAILKIEFYNLLLGRKIKELKKGKYRIMYKQLGFSRKLRLEIQGRWPNLYQKIWLIKLHLKSRIKAGS